MAYTDTRQRLLEAEGAGNTARFALVAEGGGQKGIFTAGVLDAFLDNEFWPFDLKVGVSAGAQNLAAYSARARQYAKAAIQQLTTREHFFRPARFFTGGNAIDLDWYFEQVAHHDTLKFPTKPHNLLPDNNFFAVASDADTLEAHYLHTWHSNMLPHLKASSAIPFLYRSGVEVSGRRMMDGGVADPLPVKWAYMRGARQIWVIRTVPAGDDGRLPVLDRIGPIIRKVRQSPRVFELYENYQARYAQALEFIGNPPPDVEIRQISPPRELLSMVVGSPRDTLNQDYLLGRREGNKALQSWLNRAM